MSVLSVAELVLLLGLCFLAGFLGGPCLCAIVRAVRRHLPTKETP